MPAAESEPRAERLRARLGAARLYLIAEAEPNGLPAAGLLRAALAGGVDAVQLREKSAGRDAILRAAESFRAICDEHSALFVVNDDPELALECGADGVHVGQGDVAVERAREIVGSTPLIGVSTHAPAELDAALRSSADYVGVGPVHATPTKPGRAAVGTELVRIAAARTGEVPFFAIGGIDAGNVAEVIAAGARRVAVVRAIRDAGDPEASAAALRAAVEAGDPVGAAQ